jgi:hypothetical protein
MDKSQRERKRLQKAGGSEGKRFKTFTLETTSEIPCYEHEHCNALIAVMVQLTEQSDHQKTGLLLHLIRNCSILQ